MKNLGAAMAGGNGNRVKDDFYPTPRLATLALLPLIRHWPRRVWEPACGNGAISEVLKEYGFEVWSTDLVDRGYGIGGIDFLSADGPSTIITNPPFALAEDFIRHAKKIGTQHLALLLKSTYWHAARRADLWFDHACSGIYPLTWRLDFDGRGAPVMDCSWMLWDWSQSEQRTYTMFDPLPKPVDLFA